MSRPVAYLRVWFTTARPPPEAKIETKLTCSNGYGFSESRFNRSVGGFGLGFGGIDNRKQGGFVFINDVEAVGFKQE